MKYKKTIILGAGILLSIVLGACNNKSDNNNQSQSISKITQSSHKKNKTSNNQQDSSDTNSSVNTNSQNNISSSSSVNNNDNQSSITNNANNQSSSINNSTNNDNNQNSLISNDKNTIPNTNKNTMQNTTLTVPQLGTLACLYNRPEWFNTYINNDLWCGTINANNQDNYANNLAGYHFVTAQGDPTSWLYYKQVGNNVILKYINASDVPVYKAPMVQQIVPMSTLINNYYHNSEQQKQVNNYANQLKPYNN